MEKITLNVTEVANVLGISKDTVYKMVREGEIPHKKARGKIIFNREQIIEWTKGD